MKSIKLHISRVDPPPSRRPSLGFCKPATAMDFRIMESMHIKLVNPRLRTFIKLNKGLNLQRLKAKMKCVATRKRAEYHTSYSLRMPTNPINKLRLNAYGILCLLESLCFFQYHLSMITASTPSFHPTLHSSPWISSLLLLHIINNQALEINLTYFWIY